MSDQNDAEIEQLADNCRFENARFQREGASDPKPCFELFKRALADQNSLALNHIYAIYLPKMQWWAQRYIGSSDVGEDPEFIAEVAFFNFYRASIGDRFHQKFQSLPQIIRFMQTCVFNLIRQYWRDSHDLDEEFPNTDLPSPNQPDSGGRAQELWAHICELIPEPDDQLLAWLSFVLDMKPAEIVKYDEYRDKWPTSREVSVALYRIRRILRGDDDLGNWLNNS